MLHDILHRLFVSKCEYSYVPWFIFDDRLVYDPSNTIMVIITQATSEGSNYLGHQHSFAESILLKKYETR